MDLLTKRSAASEQVLGDVHSGLKSVSDPTPLLTSASSSLEEVEALKAKVKRAEDQAKAFQKHILESEQELMAARRESVGPTGVPGGEEDHAGNAEETAALRAEVERLRPENARLATVEEDLMRTAAQLGEAKMALAEGGGSKNASDGASEAASLRAELEKSVAEKKALVSARCVCREVP